jgi:hypothetical protein|tara:strand:- start:355 stop:666 length:312 start_codon:yes stop_codon:yes gene_type:complete
MPEKECPDCVSKVHVRVRECSCGYVFPVKQKKKKTKKDNENKDPEYTFNGWKKIPARSRMLTCGTCRRKMKGGDLGWHCAYDDGEKYWWCEKCMNSIGEYSNV